MSGRRQRTRVLGTSATEYTDEQRALARQLLERGVRVAELHQGCQLCPRAIRRGQLIGLGPTGWAHVECLPAELTQRSSKGRRAERRAAARRADRSST